VEIKISIEMEISIKNNTITRDLSNSLRNMHVVYDWRWDA